MAKTSCPLASAHVHFGMQVAGHIPVVQWRTPREPAGTSLVTPCETEFRLMPADSRQFPQVTYNYSNYNDLGQLRI